LPDGLLHKPAAIAVYIVLLYLRLVHKRQL
jgi:hypothetical protein